MSQLSTIRTYLTENIFGILYEVEIPSCFDREIQNRKHITIQYICMMGFDQYK